jgi:hypothetical protein
LGVKNGPDQKSTSSEFYYGDLGQVQTEITENGKIRYECKFYKCTGGTVGGLAMF